MNDLRYEKRMTPRVAKWIGLGALQFAFALLAGCATGTGKTQTITAAGRLESSAVTFAAATCSGPGIQCVDDGYVVAASRFAADAREFHETVGNEGERAVLSSFERLWHSYQKLRYEVSRSGDRQLQADLKPATEAFTNAQQHVKQWYSHADHALYGRGGYVLDPYYN
jgi:hypothetical protein